MFPEHQKEQVHHGASNAAFASLLNASGCGQAIHCDAASPCTRDLCGNAATRREKKPKPRSTRQRPAN